MNSEVDYYCPGCRCELIEEEDGYLYCPDTECDSAYRYKVADGGELMSSLQELSEGDIVRMEENGDKTIRKIYNNSMLNKRFTFEF